MLGISVLLVMQRDNNSMNIAKQFGYKQDVATLVEMDLKLISRNVFAQEFQVSE